MKLGIGVPFFDLIDDIASIEIAGESILGIRSTSFLLRPGVRALKVEHTSATEAIRLIDSVTNGDVWMSVHGGGD